MVDSNLPHDRWLEMLAAEVGAARTVMEGAPSRLKAKIYSALLRRQQESGPLLSLSETWSAGRGLCVYEKLVQILPVGERAKCFKPRSPRGVSCSLKVFSRIVSLKL